MKQIDTKAEIIFLESKWIRNMNIRTKRELYKEIVRLVDKTGKALRYQAEGRKAWMMELKNTDLIIEWDWLKSIKPTIDWDKETISLKEIQIEEIYKWLRNLKNVFGKLPEKELSSRRSEMDHTIKLSQEDISSSSLIPAKPSDNELIKEYLNKMLNKG